MSKIRLTESQLRDIVTESTMQYIYEMVQRGELDEVTARDLFGFFGHKARKGAEKAGEELRDTAEKVASGVRDTAGRVKSGVKGAAGKVKSGVKGAAEKVASGVRDTAGRVKSGVKGAAEKVAGGVKGAAEKVAGGVKGAAEKVAGGVKDTAGKVAKGVSDAWESGKETYDKYKSAADEYSGAKTKQRQASKEARIMTRKYISVLEKMKNQMENSGMFNDRASQLIDALIQTMTLSKQSKNSFAARMGNKARGIADYRL